MKDPDEDSSEDSSQQAKVKKEDRHRIGLSSQSSAPEIAGNISSFWFCCGIPCTFSMLVWSRYEKLERKIGRREPIRAKEARVRLVPAGKARSPSSDKKALWQLFSLFAGGLHTHGSISLSCVSAGHATAASSAQRRTAASNPSPGRRSAFVLLLLDCVWDTNDTDGTKMHNVYANSSSMHGGPVCQQTEEAARCRPHVPACAT